MTFQNIKINQKVEKYMTSQSTIQHPPLYQTSRSNTKHKIFFLFWSQNIHKHRIFSSLWPVVQIEVTVLYINTPICSLIHRDHTNLLFSSSSCSAHSCITLGFNSWLKFFLTCLTFFVSSFFKKLYNCGFSMGLKSCFNYFLSR